MPAPDRMLSPAPTQPVRVWDLPTRLFHWLLAAAVFGSLTTAWIGNAAMAWHLRCGQLVLALLLFRIIWGFIGGRWSRFASFLYAPGSVLRYLRGQGRAEDHFEVGHNPLGSLSVWALLALLLVQVATGLVADDEISTRGPLNRFVSNARALSATGWHKAYGQWVLLTLVGLHIGAIAFYLLRQRNNLIQAMLSGDKPLPHDTPASVDKLGTRLLALTLAVVCAALAFWVGSLGD
jgi:cytochrome b